MKVRFLNLSITDHEKRGALLEAIEKVFLHGQILLGPEVEEFEKNFSSYCGVKYGVGVSSGTDALYLALRSVDIGEGDEVITTCLSWIATANAIALTGAKPVFVDIRKDFNIDTSKIEKAITSKTKAIVPVHFTGKMCDMEPIMRIAQKYGLNVIEDAAQAFGASFKGKKAGSFSIVSSFSLNPMKVLAACGEAGMVITDDRNIYNKLQALRYNGTIDRVNAHYVSHNARIDTLQAAILLERLKHYQKDMDIRRQSASYYNKNLKNIVSVPEEADGYEDVFFTYNIQCERRDELQNYLFEKGIETKIHHPLLMPMHKAYLAEEYSNWPVGMEIISCSICLPIHEKITREEQDYVIGCIQNFYN